MSIIFESNNCVLISHEKFIHVIYKNVHRGSEVKSYVFKKELFAINRPYKQNNKKKSKKRKHAEIDEQFKDFLTNVEHIKKLFESFYGNYKNEVETTEDNNKQALEAAETIYDNCNKNLVTNAIGKNSDTAVITNINGNNYLFPKNCHFYCKNVISISNELLNQKFDLIVLDPPWWNKYIRRKKAKTEHSYQMMYNEELKAIPIEDLLEENGLVVVWCTNSFQHLNVLKNEIFLKWKCKFKATWFWLKVTKSMEPICNFTDPPGKQPFEQIIFGCNNDSIKDLSDGKLIISTPSALHSHKPPLIELLKPFLPNNPKCLEIFARYLLPNFTSYGLEAIKLQNESLYEERN